MLRLSLWFMIFLSNGPLQCFYTVQLSKSTAIFSFSFIAFVSSGKRYLLRGEETKEQGLVIKALEDIFGLIELSQQSQNTVENMWKSSSYHQVSCCMFCVYEGSSVNLLAERQTRVKVNCNCGLKSIIELSV